MVKCIAYLHAFESQNTTKMVMSHRKDTVQSITYNISGVNSARNCPATKSD